LPRTKPIEVSARLAMLRIDGERFFQMNRGLRGAAIL
jgi:hypothetical protein